MREVTDFVVIFPARMIKEPLTRKKALIDALRREYPHYSFRGTEEPGLMDEEDFGIIPIMGVVGSGEGDDPDRVYICKPIDPRIIPQLTRSLMAIEQGAALVH